MTHTTVLIDIEQVLNFVYNNRINISPINISPLMIVFPIYSFVVKTSLH